MVDYSKWDKMEFSDDDDDDDDQQCHCHHHHEHDSSEEDEEPPAKKQQTKEQSSSQSSKGAKRGKKKKPNVFFPDPNCMTGFGACSRTPEFVKLAPGDDGKGLHPLFFTSPENFQPHRVTSPLNPSKKIVLDRWGFPPVEDDSMASMMRQMNVQFLYMQSDLKYPETQFVRVLEKKRLQEFDDFRKKDPGILKRDLVLKVQLIKGWNANANPPTILPPPYPVFRELRVSGGVMIRSFVDKILLPTIGFRRNYHAYAFTDCESGIPFGPTKSRAVDICHIPMHFYCLSSDEEVYVGDILKEKDDTAFFCYDLGDQWECFITVQEVVPVEKSNGKVMILGGHGNAPPEDSNGLEGKGNKHFYKLYNQIATLKKAKKNPSMKLKQALKEASESANFSIHCSGTASVTPSELNAFPYDPTFFDLNECRMRVKEAIQSSTSLEGGEMTFTHHFSTPFTSSDGKDPFMAHLEGKGEMVRRPMKNLPGSCLQEIVPGKDAVDTEKLSICGSCGAPAKLLCSRCKRVRYCGRACQKAAWSLHKLDCSPSTSNFANSSTSNFDEME